MKAIKLTLIFLSLWIVEHLIVAGPIALVTWQPYTQALTCPGFLAAEVLLGWFLPACITAEIRRKTFV